MAMKKLLLILSLFLGLNAYSQIKITPFDDPSIDITNTTIEVLGSSSDFGLEYYAKVINLGGSSVTLKVKTTEIDVLSNTEHTTCWELCPPYVTSGSQEIYLSPHSGTITALDTNDSFVAHYRTGSQDGCSLIKYDWVDANDTSIVYSSLSVRFTHSTSICMAGIDQEIQLFKIYPNPTSNVLTILNSGQTILDHYVIYNIAGEKILGTSNTNLQSDRLTLDTQEFDNGYYIIQIFDDSNHSSCLRFAIQH